MIFEKYSLSMGLSQSSVYCIIQDTRGFIWMGTQFGLNRFDGSSFRKYFFDAKNKKSLNNDLVKTSYKDYEGNLWFGTLYGGISRYLTEKDEFRNYELDLKDGKSKSEFVVSICGDKMGRIWAATRNNGLWVLDNKDSEFKKMTFNVSQNVDGKLTDCISALYIDSKEQIWAGTWESGAYLFSHDFGNCIHFFNDSEENFLPHDHVRDFFEDADGNIWIGTQSGLTLYNNDMCDIRRLPLRNNFDIESKCVIASICSDKSNGIWIGTLDNGLFHFPINGEPENLRTNIMDHSSLSENSILSLHSDDSNVLWIGTMSTGANKVDLEKKVFHSISKFRIKDEDRVLQIVQSVCEDSKGKIWAGTHNKGLFVFESNGELHHLTNKYIGRDKTIEGNIISSILDDGRGSIWIGSFSGTLYKYDLNTNSISKFLLEDSEGIHCLYLHNNHIIIGTDRAGLITLDLKTETLSPFKQDSKLNGLLLDKTIFTVLVDEENKMWIGTKVDGLYRYDMDNNLLTSFQFSDNDDSSLSDNCVISLFEGSDGRIWIGTLSGGLNFFDKTIGGIVRVTANNLSKESIRGFSQDSRDRLWLSTNSGIICYNPVDDTYRQFNSSDGLQSNEFNENSFFTSKSGVVYFGGVEGITYFKPEEIKDNPYIPNVVLTDFEIFNESVNPSELNPFLRNNISYADEINLTYKESVFSFRFAALIFNNPKKNQYAYKMEGFDKDWTYCGTRTRVTYTNLDPGQYIFKVKGSNNDGIWNEEGASIRINITPPYWKTWWFKSLGTIALMAATGLSYKQRLDKMEKERKDQEEFSRRLIESQEDERKRIATELHHTIAHDVLISKNKALMALKHKDNPEKMEHTLREIAELASSTMTDVRSISYNLHPHQLESLGFSKALKSIITEVAKSTETQFTFEIDEVDKLLTKENEINLFRAIQESVSNVIRHSGAKEAFLKVNRNEGFIFIVLSDNGKGFDAKKISLPGRKHGLGLQGIMERIKYMKGEYRIESEPGKGTTIFYKIPINLS